MSGLLDGLVSAIGELFTTVQTTVVATQTTAPTSQTQQIARTTTSSTSTTSSDTTTSEQTEQNVPQTTADPTTAQALQPVVVTTITTSVTSTRPTSTIASTIASTIPSTTSSRLTTSSTRPQPSLTTRASSSTSTSSSVPVASSFTDSGTPTDTDRRPAIIGGVIGAIVGVVIISLLVFFCCLRRRRRKRDSEIFEQSLYDEPKLMNDSPRPAPYRQPTGTSELNFGYAAPLARPAPASMKSFKSSNGTLIHMNTDHFTRPFSEQEGYRDSVQAGSLRVTNPDRSQPVTPNVAATADPMNRWRPVYPSTIHEKEIAVDTAAAASKTPIIHIEEASPDELVAPSYRNRQYTPSFRSYPSIHTSSPRNSRWINEAPPMPEEQEQQKPKRPSMTPLHSVASRTLSSIGNALRLSSGKTGEREHVPESGYATSIATSRHASAVSDPFDLDSPTRRSAMPQWNRLSTPRNVTTYEGT